MSNRRRARSPVDDQLLAALAESRLMYDRMQELVGASHAPVGACAQWINGVVEDVFATMRAGTTEFCAHAAVSPRPVHVGAWNRRLVVCSSCVAMLRLTGPEDYRCDRCQQVNQRIASSTTWAEGVMFLHLGLCRACVLALDVPMARTAS